MLAVQQVAQDSVRELREVVSGYRAAALDFRGRAGAAAGYYNPRTATFALQAVPGQQAGATRFRRGAPGAVPLIGDWAAAGTDGPGPTTRRPAGFTCGISLAAGRPAGRSGSGRRA